MKRNCKTWVFLPMRCLLFLAAFSLCSLITRKKLTELTHWWTLIASAINLVTIIVLWRICKHENVTFRELIRYDKRQKGFFRGALFLVLMLLIGMGGMYLAGWLCYGTFPYLAPMMIAPVPPYLAVLNVFVLPLTTTVAEDGIYLGCGVNGFPSERSAVLIPAFFYALQHSFIPTLMDVRFMTYRFLSFLPLTLWICLQYHRKGRIAYIMAGHWLLNVATTVQIIVTSFHPEIYPM